MQTQTETKKEVLWRGGNGDASTRKEVQTIKLDLVKKNLSDLMVLYRRQQEASEGYSAETKAIAEKAGLLPAVLRKYVKACCGDKFDEAKQEVEQLSLVFESIE